MTNMGEVFNDYTTDASNRNSFESSFYTMQKMHGDAQHRVWELEAALLEIFDHECRTSDKSFIACAARDALWPKALEKKDG